MENIYKQDIIKDLDRFSKANIMVVGDMAIDEMVYGQAERISREAPVLILKHSHTNVLLGAASNAAHNIASLGAKKVSVVGVYGNDFHAPQLLEAFHKANVDTSLMVKDVSRPTSTKTRISAASKQSVTQQIVRIDRESNNPVSAKIESKLINTIYEKAKDFDAILLSDYGIGVVTPNIIDAVSEIAKKENIIYAVDAQTYLTRFKQATVITPNQPEAENTLNRKLETYEDVVVGAKELVESANLKMILITRGGEGMVLVEKSGRITSIPAFNKSDVFDVTGAGDTVVGTLILALASNLDPRHAAVLGNLAASIVIRHFGAAVTTIEELKTELDKLKINTLAESTR